MELATAALAVELWAHIPFKVFKPQVAGTEAVRCCNYVLCCDENFSASRRLEPAPLADRAGMLYATTSPALFNRTQHPQYSVRSPSPPSSSIGHFRVY